MRVEGRVGAKGGGSRFLLGAIVVIDQGAFVQ